MLSMEICEKNRASLVALRRATLSLFSLLPLAFLLPMLAGAPAHAQSCILTRLDSPVLSAFEPLAEEEKWQVSFSWRYGRSFRHFVGTDEQEQRVREHSNVINNVHLADLSVQYKFNARTSLTFGVPYLMATRSGPIRSNGEQIGRQVRSNTRGIGDATLVAQHLLWDPATHHRSNFSLGLGIKFPSGQNSVQDSLLVVEDGELVPQVRTADQSVQPGDGGFGLVVQLSGYKVFNQAETVAGYFSSTYIIEPEGDSGVLTYRRSVEEQVMSISDQYVARAGVQFGPHSWNGWSVGIGGRIEGIPVHDLFGSSDGFRRPGYMASIEPSVSWSHGPHTVTLAVPWAVERNRQASVPDIHRGRHGDAAFPDFIVLTSYAVRF